ncbi:MAG: GNAT family N-acetyltransferase [Trebonia sp.]
MNNVELRAAEPRDLPMIFRAERDYMTQIEPGQLPGWLAAVDRNLELWIANLERTLVALIDGVEAGYTMWTREGTRATLITIHVLARHRRRGIGGRLLSAVISAAAQDRATALDLGVHVGNGARALYEQAGFTHIRDEGDYQLYALALTSQGQSRP